MGKALRKGFPPGTAESLGSGRPPNCRNFGREESGPGLPFLSGLLGGEEREAGRENLQRERRASLCPSSLDEHYRGVKLSANEIS